MVGSKNFLNRPESRTQLIPPVGTIINSYLSLSS